MADTYQAIYDAVRSRISGGNIGDAVADAARNAFDISWAVEHIKQEFVTAAHEMQRPSVLFKPRVFPDGTSWCALLGDNLVEGVAGFGNTPDEACAAFDQAWRKGLTPAAARAAAAMDAS